ncbi:MAG: hypothetical protein ACJ78I_12620, partial [Gemmatimonadaceae bacterium]
MAVFAAFALLACHHRPGPDFSGAPEGMRIRAETRLVGKSLDTLQVWMTGVNSSRQPQSFGYSLCPEVTTRISSIHIPSGKPTRTWDYATMLHPELAKQQVTSMCSREASTGVMPGDSATFIFLSVPVNRILGDSLSTGRYRVTVFP